MLGTTGDFQRRVAEDAAGGLEDGSATSGGPTRGVEVSKATAAMRVITIGITVPIGVTVYGD
jgi:hypothetical protein